MLTPDVPTSSGPSPVGRYREPSVLPDGRILVSWADGPVNDLSEQSITPPDFGVYIYDPNTRKNQLLYNERDRWELNAIPVVERREPPAIGDIVAKNVDPGTPVRIGSIDITRTSLQETVRGAQFGMGVPLSEALKQAVKVRIIEGFSTEGVKGATMFGLTMDEGGAVLGEADVYADGSWLAEIPPYLPVHVQPVDKFGLSIRNQRLWIQGMPGEDRRCVGCHEQRSGGAAPRIGQNPTVAEQRQAQQFLMPIQDRRELPWAFKAASYPGATAPARLIQNILNAKCVQCHGAAVEPQVDPFKGKTYQVTASMPGSGTAQTYNIPYLDLTETEIEVYYDMQVNAYPKSYVSLFYPSTLEMGMGTQTVGQVAPLWAIPNNARESVMIRKLNVRAPDGTFAFGTPVMHPEDVGVTLTDDERLQLIQSIDIGGQYWARQNSGFVPFTAGDPVAPGTRY
jgi:hypothetical protein